MKKIKIFLNKISKLFRIKPDEIDAFLKNGLYPHLSQGQIGYILNVINKEIKKSSGFGLEILPEHQLKEKCVIMKIFNEWGQTLQIEGPEYSGLEYEQAISSLYKMAYAYMDDEVTYYFESFPENSVRNRYNCHLECLVSRLAKDFMDDRVPLR